MKLQVGEQYVTRAGKTAIVVAIGLALGCGYSAIAIIQNKDGSTQGVFQYTENGVYTTGEKSMYDLVCLKSELEGKSLKEGTTYTNKRGNKVVILKTTKDSQGVSLVYGYEEFEGGRHETVSFSLFGDYRMGYDDVRDLLLDNS